MIPVVMVVSPVARISVSPSSALSCAHGRTPCTASPTCDRRRRTRRCVVRRRPRQRRRPLVALLAGVRSATDVSSGTQVECSERALPTVPKARKLGIHGRAPVAQTEPQQTSGSRREYLDLYRLTSDGQVGRADDLNARQPPEPPSHVCRFVLHGRSFREARICVNQPCGFPAVFGRGISASRTSLSTMPLRVSPHRVAISSRRLRASSERVSCTTGRLRVTGRAPAPRASGMLGQAIGQPARADRRCPIQRRCRIADTYKTGARHPTCWRPSRRPRRRGAYRPLAGCARLRRSVVSLIPSLLLSLVRVKLARRGQGS